MATPNAMTPVVSVRRCGIAGQYGSASPPVKLRVHRIQDASRLFLLHVQVAVPRDAERGEESGRWVNMFFMSFANTIAGGTSEIQRNIIAQRVLGLPRA